MRIKIFCAPGNARNDFEAVEQQVNDWIDKQKPSHITLHCSVNNLPDQTNSGQYIMTITVQYEPSS